MKTIPIEVIERHWAALGEMDEAQVTAMAERMQTEQPYIMVYLLAAADMEEDPEADSSQLMEIGGGIWYVISQVKPGLRMVTDKELEAAESANFEFLQKLDDGPEAQLQTAGQSMFQSYNQMPLLGLAIEALMEGNEDCPELAQESIGLDLIHLKTVIDCLDQ